MADLIIKKGDSSPVLNWTVVDASGTAVNLTGATVTFVMRTITAVSPAVNATATIVSGPAGTVSYTFTATDTATAGQYQGEFHCTLSGGAKFTSPTDGYIEILVEEDLVTATPVGRLVSLGDVKDHLRIPATNRTQDAALLRLVDAMTPVVESFTGPIVQRIYNEVYDGGGNFISLRHRPVVSVEMVAEYRGPVKYDLTQVPTPDLGSIYSYAFEPSGRLLRRSVGGGTTSFPIGLGAVFVSYIAGYATVPANVKWATLELVRVNFQQTEQGGRPAFGTGGQSAAMPDEIASMQMLGYLVPNRVREALAPHRRHPSVA